MTITLKIGGATTGRKFTDPIRYFKANDPYYWEVDNIPLKQLQENVKYVNDRLNTAIVSGTLDIGRQDIAELKPYVNGSDDRVRVKPGRYTARVNNAHGIDRLDSFIRQVTSDVEGNYTNYAWLNSATVDALITRIQSAAGDDSLNLNGLSERVFAQLARSPDEVVDPGDEESGFPRTALPLPSTEAISQTGGQYSVDAFPISEYLGWYRHYSNFVSGATGATLFQTATQASDDPNRLLHLPILENALIKYWRGTARTAIVDVPAELDIQIRPFDADDFPVAGATSRIDLVFIYSKPVDTSAVTIGKYDSATTQTNRTKITEPILGVLEGAGLGVDTSQFAAVPSVASDGTSRILASVADQNNTDNGFKVGVNQEVAIHGSFPSPEDLLNIAPLLSEQLSEDSWFLTGQTVFPVAYIKVNQGAAVSVTSPNGVVIQDDIVDIRPLFRTAELTYNERAGIAAAMPPLSLANRAVGRYELEYEINNISENHDSRLDALENSTMALRTEQSYWLPGAFGFPGQNNKTSGRNIFDTSGPQNSGECYVNFLSMIGLDDSTREYDVGKYIPLSVVGSLDKVKALTFSFRSGHIPYGRDIISEPPRIYINCESQGVGSIGNQAQPAGKQSKYYDRMISHFGTGIKEGKEWFTGSNFNEFTIPVEVNTVGKIEIYVWSSDDSAMYVSRGNDRFEEYHVLTLQGCIYEKDNVIRLVP